MFKRLNRSKEPTISGPTGVVETTLPEGYLDSIPEVGSPVNVQSPGLPPLPFRAVPPIEQANLNFADRASSVYSQPHDYRESARIPSSVYTDVSPPQTPKPPPQESAHSPEISPIEPEVPPWRESQRENTNLPRSNIPVPQKRNVSSNGPIKKFTNSPGWRRDANADGETRWDEYSGEPAFDNEGKVATFQPSAAERIVMARQKGRQIFNGLRDRDPARRKAAKKQSRAEEEDSNLPPERPPWQGASGRTAIVSAPRDDFSKRLAPLQIPKKTRNQVNSSVRPVQSETDEDIIKPTVPLKTGTLSPRVISPNGPLSPQYSSRPLAGSPSMQTVQSSDSARTAKQTGNADAFASGALPNEQEIQDHVDDLNFDDQPGSRFSSTTVATTARGSPHSSPRHSVDAPPVPSLPSPSTLPQRPIPGSPGSPLWKANAKITARKPISSERTSSIYSATSNRTKTLPLVPPETEAIDKVAGMQAKLDALARRRRNIEKVLKDLSHVINPTSPGYDLKTKSDVSQTVNALKDELSAIGQEEHDVGLSLHRAYKKRDQEGIYQSTGLWIKRVTS